MVGVTTEVGRFPPFRSHSVTEIILPPYMRGRGSVVSGANGKLVFEASLLEHPSVFERCRNTSPSRQGNSDELVGGFSIGVEVSGTG